MEAMEKLIRGLILNELKRVADNCCEGYEFYEDGIGSRDPYDVPTEGLRDAIRKRIDELEETEVTTNDDEDLSWTKNSSN